MASLRPGRGPLEELSHRALRDRLKHAEEAFDELDAVDVKEVLDSGQLEESLNRMDAATATIEESRAELSRRAEADKRTQFREAVDAIPRNREIEKRRRAPHPAHEPLGRVARRHHPELKGVTELRADRLSREQGDELADLVKRLRSGGKLDDSEHGRYEGLVGLAASGDVDFFKQQRRKMEVAERMARIKEEQRLDALPKRPVYAEPGSVTVPQFVFGWLRDSRDQSWTVADTAMLYALLGMFENRQPLFLNAAFEDDGDEPVLVVRGGLSDLRFRPGSNGNAVDSTGSGFVREREALRTLVRNEWFRAADSATEIRIKLGPLAKELRNGKQEQAPAMQ